MFLPLSDHDRQQLKPAYVTWSLLILNVIVFLVQQSDPAFTNGYSAVPAEITGGVDIVEPVPVEVAPGNVIAIPHSPGPSPIYLTLLSSMFMHAGIMHLAGNMLFLWIFGDNVEHRFGHLPFLIFYLASGLAASVAHIVGDPNSIVPSLGASGAISGVMGAYLVLFPRNMVYSLFFFRIIRIPAFIVIGIWAVGQFISGYASMSQVTQTGGVAYLAHIGGFVAGVVAGLIYRSILPEEPPTVFQRRYDQDHVAHRLW